ncbi:hypothetical protein IWW48_005083 [Coemansia sp. RSA 1200]|nr:hypothetical protein IWW48_005083 [Coemansia sp. RSA 1200]
MSYFAVLAALLAVSSAAPVAQPQVDSVGEWYVKRSPQADSVGEWYVKRNPQVDSVGEWYVKRNPQVDSVGEWYVKRNPEPVAAPNPAPEAKGADKKK